MEKIVYCADVIARLGSVNGPFVLIERLGSAKGLRLPGGKQEEGEMLSDTAQREFFEETGLTLTITDVFGTRAEKERDPRGHYVTTIFVGIATGTIQNEPDKTRVMLCERLELEQEARFAFDHFAILSSYLDIVAAN